MARSVPKVGGIVVICLAVVAALGFWVVRPLLSEPTGNEPLLPSDNLPSSTVSQRSPIQENSGQGQVSLTQGNSTDTTVRAMNVRGRTASLLNAATQKSSLLDVIIPGQGSADSASMVPPIDLSTPPPPVDDDTSLNRPATPIKTDNK